LIDILVRMGPFRLFELGKEEYGYQGLPEGYAGKCHLCVEVRKHLSKQGDFKSSDQKSSTKTSSPMVRTDERWGVGQRSGNEQRAEEMA
jgi:hypothetical protein